MNQEQHIATEIKLPNYGKTSIWIIFFLNCLSFKIKKVALDVRRAVDTSISEKFWQQGVDFHIVVLSVIIAKHAIKLTTKASVPTLHARWC